MMVRMSYVLLREIKLPIYLRDTRKFWPQKQRIIEGLLKQKNTSLSLIYFYKINGPIVELLNMLSC